MEAAAAPKVTSGVAPKLQEAGTADTAGPQAGQDASSPLPQPAPLVEEPPKIWLPRFLKQTYIRKVGDTVNLLIPFQGRPKPRATWTHNGHALDTSRVSVRDGEHDSVLFVREAQRTDSGHYQLSLQLGGLEDTATIDILVVALVHGARRLPPHQLRHLQPHRRQLIHLPGFCGEPVRAQRDGRRHSRCGSRAEGSGCVQDGRVCAEGVLGSTEVHTAPGRLHARPRLQHSALLLCSRLTQAQDHLAEEQDGDPGQPQIQSPHAVGNLLPGDPQARPLRRGHLHLQGHQCPGGGVRGVSGGHAGSC
ncbi:myosin-binding protein H-like isoform X5 [Sorex araneus]|uniref:myosin-binding protein H-like isoform X5 n=1 Tax=Sorex araneus TaxID=42254 RepID=UPI002433958D|nr:myosin-binding protein H-like isoform X5 [Sorex araneus]